MSVFREAVPSIGVFKMKWVNVTQSVPTSFEMMLLREFGIRVDLSANPLLTLGIAALIMLIAYRAFMPVSRHR